MGTEIKFKTFTGYDREEVDKQATEFVKNLETMTGNKFLNHSSSMCVIPSSENNILYGITISYSSHSQLAKK
jgi:hypothetical protein